MVIYQKLLPRTKKRAVFYLSLKISSLNRLASYDEYPPGLPVMRLLLLLYISYRHCYCHHTIHHHLHCWNHHNSLIYSSLLTFTFSHITQCSAHVCVLSLFSHITQCSAHVCVLSLCSSCDSGSQHCTPISHPV